MKGKNRILLLQRRRRLRDSGQLFDANHTSTNRGQSSKGELKRQALENEQFRHEVGIEAPRPRYRQVRARN
jgi:hypothetical protein